MGLLDGMEDFGLGKMTTEDIFADPKAKEEALKAKAAAEKVFVEEEFLFEKTYECPVCYKSFKEHTLRTGKARLVKTDMDLRPTFEGIEPLKYDIVQCKECGFTAVTRYFVPMTVAQRKAVLEKVSTNFKKSKQDKKTYSYDEAVARYRLALVNAIVKQSKASEKAYICLRGGWLCKSYIEAMQEGREDAAKLAEMVALEEEFLKNAYEGFIAAEQNEAFPMCGMDESTVDYLVATLAIRFRHLDVASKLISSLLVSPSCNSRVKDKVRDLKDEVIRLQKEMKK